MKNSFEDHEVITRLISGNDTALYQLYDKYSGALYGVILRMCRDRTKAEDLLQETFVKIWNSIDTYDASKGRFYTWAYRIARNTTLNSMRTKDKLIQTDDLSVYTNIKDDEEAPDYSELKGQGSDFESQ